MYTPPYLLHQLYTPPYPLHQLTVWIVQTGEMELQEGDDIRDDGTLKMHCTVVMFTAMHCGALCTAQ